MTATQKTIARETTRALRRIERNNGIKPPPKPKKPRKKRVSAKARTLCMWHPPEQCCALCNGGKLEVVKGFATEAACDGREPVRMCRSCWSPITKQQWEGTGAMGCPVCGKAPA